MNKPGENNCPLRKGIYLQGEVLILPREPGGAFIADLDHFGKIQ